MSILPTILPADPAAPEEHQHQTRKLSYGILGRLYMFVELARERHTLAQMDDHLLRDIGMTRDDARREYRKPFWDVPAGWRADAERCLSHPGLL